jgi:hypothetical protein
MGGARHHGHALGDKALAAPACEEEDRPELSPTRSSSLSIDEAHPNDSARMLQVAGVFAGP